MHNDFSPHSISYKIQHSNDSERKKLAKMIVENKLNIKLLSQIMDENTKIATRFMWLLSDIGEYEPMFLFSYLEFLFSIANKYPTIKFKQHFAKYWKLCGIPESQEAEALDYLMQLLNSSSTNVSTKVYAMEVLYCLSKKYPDIKNELTILIENQLDKNSETFKKKAKRLINKLNNF